MIQGSVPDATLIKNAARPRPHMEAPRDRGEEAAGAQPVPADGQPGGSETATSRRHHAQGRPEQIGAPIRKTFQHAYRAHIHRKKPRGKPMANLSYNFRRLIFHERRQATA